MLFKRSFPVVDLHTTSLEQDAVSVLECPGWKGLARQGCSAREGLIPAFHETHCRVQVAPGGWIMASLIVL